MDFNEQPATPAEQPAEQTAVQTAPERNDAPTSREELAGLFAKQLAEEDAPAQKQQVEQAAPESEAAPAEEISESVTAETTQEESAPETDPAKPDDGLRGMSEADKAVFAQLPTELKAFVSKRMAETNADYTRKTQEVAEHRKAVTAEREALAGRLQQYDAILAQYTEPELAPPDPALRYADPGAFDEQMAAYVHGKHVKEKAAQQRQQLAQQYEHLHKRQQAEFFMQQEQILEQAKSPLAGNTKEAMARRKSCFDYAVKSGIPPAVLNQASALELMMLDKARLYDASQAARANVKTVPAPALRVAKPGPARAVGRPSNVQSAINNLSANPTRDSLAAAYAAQLAAER